MVFCAWIGITAILDSNVPITKFVIVASSKDQHNGVNGPGHTVILIKLCRKISLNVKHTFFQKNLEIFMYLPWQFKDTKK